MPSYPTVMKAQDRDTDRLLFACKVIDKGNEEVGIIRSLWTDIEAMVSAESHHVLSAVLLH